jgi:hypothetical protein
MATLLLLIHWVLAPIAAAFMIKNVVFCGVLTFVTVFVFWSINFIAAELEMPFGDDPNDLPVGDMQAKFNRSLRRLVNPLVQRPPEFSFDADVHYAPNLSQFEHFNRMTCFMPDNVSEQQRPKRLSFTDRLRRESLASSYQSEVSVAPESGLHLLTFGKEVSVPRAQAPYFTPATETAELRLQSIREEQALECSLQSPPLSCNQPTTSDGPTPINAGLKSGDPFVPEMLPIGLARGEEATRGRGVVATIAFHRDTGNEPPPLCDKAEAALGIQPVGSWRHVPVIAKSDSGFSEFSI